MSAILDKLLKGQKVEWLPINEIVLPTKNIKWKDVDSGFARIFDRISFHFHFSIFNFQRTTVIHPV